MLMWSVRQLAQQSGVSESSIRRIESEFGVPQNVTLDMLTRIREFYEGKGFRFTFDDEDGPGVAWRRRERRRAAERRGGGGSVEASTDWGDVIAGLPMVFGGWAIANRTANRSERSFGNPR